MHVVQTISAAYLFVTKLNLLVSQKHSRAATAQQNHVFINAYVSMQLELHLLLQLLVFTFCSTSIKLSSHLKYQMLYISSLLRLLLAFLYSLPLPFSLSQAYLLLDDIHNLYMHCNFFRSLFIPLCPFILFPTYIASHPVLSFFANSAVLKQNLCLLLLILPISDCHPNQMSHSCQRLTHRYLSNLINSIVVSQVVKCPFTCCLFYLLWNPLFMKQSQTIQENQIDCLVEMSILGSVY